jgi:hypothetical protein
MCGAKSGCQELAIPVVGHSTGIPPAVIVHGFLSESTSRFRGKSKADQPAPGSTRNATQVEADEAVG